MVIPLECEPGTNPVELDRTRCLDLMRRSPVGRVVLSVQCLPVAVTVRITASDDGVLIATDRDSLLTAGVDGQVVSVQADEFDQDTHTGWSVLITGTAEHLTDPEEIGRATSAIGSWLPGPDPLLVKVTPTLVSGRVFEWSCNPNGGERDVRPT